MKKINLKEKVIKVNLCDIFMVIVLVKRNKEKEEKLTLLFSFEVTFGQLYGYFCILNVSLGILVLFLYSLISLCFVRLEVGDLGVNKHKTNDR